MAQCAQPSNLGLTLASSTPPPRSCRLHAVRRRRGVTNDDTIEHYLHKSTMVSLVPAEVRHGRPSEAVVKTRLGLTWEKLARRAPTGGTTSQ